MMYQMDLIHKINEAISQNSHLSAAILYPTYPIGDHYRTYSKQHGTYLPTGGLSLYSECHFY